MRRQVANLSAASFRRYSSDSRAARRLFPPPANWAICGFVQGGRAMGFRVGEMGGVAGGVIGGDRGIV